MGPVTLSVADLERSLEYYRRSIGLDVLAEGGGEARLGTGSTELLHLVGSPEPGPPTGTAASSTSRCSFPARRPRPLARARRP